MDQLLFLALEPYQYPILMLYIINLRKEGVGVPAAGLIPGFNSPEDESLIFSSDVSLIFVVVFSMESS
jgi:hypothetical protein